MADFNYRQKELLLKAVKERILPDYFMLNTPWFYNSFPTFRFAHLKFFALYPQNRTFYSTASSLYQKIKRDVQLHKTPEQICEYLSKEYSTLSVYFVRSDNGSSILFILVPKY
jgi:hypothetical protein